MSTRLQIVALYDNLLANSITFLFHTTSAGISKNNFPTFNYITQVAIYKFFGMRTLFLIQVLQGTRAEYCPILQH